MPVIKLEGFSGISPRTGPSQLAPNQAQTARNLKIMSGELRPWRKPRLEYQPASTAVQSIYRLENTNTGGYQWLEWDTEVDVSPSPQADVSDFRIYYTGDGVPKKTNWNLATTSGAGTKPFPDAWLHMGVPAPTVAPTLVKTGGSGTVVEDRAYIYTYVSTFGAISEESAPSPATITLAVEPNATVTVSGFGTAPFGTGYNITALRIYRSVSSSASANYLYVGQVSVNPATGVASGSFADTVLAANLGAALQSLYYTPPPTDLKGLVSMPNGVLAGFTGNQVWFCEPYVPHAWPTGYMVTVGAPIVGLGVFGQTLVVCTTEQPYLISGTQPGAMSQEKLPLPEPCASKRSIVSDQYGVLYASPNGVVSVAPGMADVISRTLFTRDEWQTFNPDSMRGLIYQNMYMLFYSGTNPGSLVITRADTPPLITLETQARAVFLRKTTAEVFFVNAIDGYIYQLDDHPIDEMVGEWLSKKFILPEPTSFAALKLQADWNTFADTSAYNQLVAQIIAQNAAILAAGPPFGSAVNDVTANAVQVNGSSLLPVPTQAESKYIQLELLCDGVTVCTASVTTQEPIRVPATFKGYVWEIRLVGNVPIRKFALATSIGELRQA